MRTPPDPPITAPLPRSWAWAWPAIRALIGLAAVGVALWVLSGKTKELHGVFHELAHVRWWWMIVAVVAESGFYLALSSLQRGLLGAGKVDVPRPQMAGIALAGQAIQFSFPGGTVIYWAYLYRQFRRFGADDLLSGWTIIAFNTVNFIALAVIAAVGLAMALSAGSAFDLVEAILGILLLATLFAIAVVERRRLLPHLTRVIRLSKRLLRGRPRPGQSAKQVVNDWTDELGAVSPTTAGWVRAGALGMSTWLADLSCLALSFMAVGAPVPWRGLLLAYGAGQLAAVLPITPGGLGVVEGSITVALVTFGGGQASTVAAVLLYRAVAFWLILPVGWSSWATLALLGRGRDRKLAKAEEQKGEEDGEEEMVRV